MPVNDRNTRLYAKAALSLMQTQSIRLKEQSFPNSTDERLLKDIIMLDTAMLVFKEFASASLDANVFGMLLSSQKWMPEETSFSDALIQAEAQLQAEENRGS